MEGPPQRRFLHLGLAGVMVPCPQSVKCMTSEFTPPDKCHGVLPPLRNNCGPGGCTYRTYGKPNHFLIRPSGLERGQMAHATLGGRFQSRRSCQPPPDPVACTIASPRFLLVNIRYFVAFGGQPPRAAHAGPLLPPDGVPEHLLLWRLGGAAPATSSPSASASRRSCDAAAAPSRGRARSFRSAVEVAPAPPPADLRRSAQGDRPSGVQGGECASRR